MTTFQQKNKKIWILTAMSEEAQFIIDLYWLEKTHSLTTISFYENAEMVLVLAGVGKVQASIATTLLVQNYSPESLINIGIAGSLLWQGAKVWDVFLIDKIVQHDMYLPFDWSHLDYAKGAIQISFNPQLDFKDFDFTVYQRGICLTWDQFLDDQQKVSQLRKARNAQVVEMEAFAFASVAREFWILEKILVIKAISDGGDAEAKSAHMDNLDFAMHNSLLVLQKVVKHLI